MLQPVLLPLLLHLLLHLLHPPCRAATHVALPRGCWQRGLLLC